MSGIVMTDIATEEDKAPKPLAKTYAYYAQFGRPERKGLTEGFKHKVAYVLGSIAVAGALWGAAEIGTNRVIEARGIDASTGLPKTDKSTTLNRPSSHIIEKAINEPCPKTITGVSTCFTI